MRRKEKIVMDSLKDRIARAAKTVPPGELLGYYFVPTQHGFVVKPISETDLGVFNEKPK